MKPENSQVLTGCEPELPRHQPADTATGGPSSSCEMIILRNKCHGETMKVCLRIFTTALRS